MLNLSEYQNLIHRVVSRVAGHSLSADDISDVVQEVNLRLCDPARRPDHDPDRGNVESWVAVMSKSMTIDYLRGLNRRAPLNAVLTTERAEWAAEAADVKDDALHLLLDQERQAMMHEAIKQLPMDDQHFLLISMRDDYDAETYAKRLNVKPVALRVRKIRLSERLRGIIKNMQD